MSDDYYTTPDGRPGITVRPQGDDDDDVEGLRRLISMVPDLSKGSGIEMLDKLIGAGGKQRFQTWPERMVRSAVTLPGQVASGEIPAYLPSVSDDPSRPDFAGNAVGGRIMNPEITERVQDLAGMAGLGAMPMAERGAVGMAGGKLVQPAKEAPVFYSGVERAIEAAPQAKMTPQQWSGYLRNQPGVKAEELQWLGLDDHTAWPGELNKGTVTKDQLLEHAEGHGVKIKEVEKKTDGGPDYIHENDLMNRQEQAVEDAFHQRYPNYADLGPGHPEYDAAYDHFKDSMVAHNIRDEINMENNAHHTKFSDYQLPGGDNYRELLLTMPHEKTYKWKQDHEGNWTADNYTIKSEPWDGRPNYVTYGEGGRRLSANDSLESAQNLVEMAGRNAPNNNVYRSSHWDEPNVLAHVRMNDRTLPLDYTPEQQAALRAHEEAKPQLDDLQKQQGEISSKIMDTARPLHQAHDDKVLADLGAGKITTVEARKLMETPHSLEEIKPLQDKLAGLRAEEDKLRSSLPDKPSEQPSLKSLHLEEIQSDWHQAGRKKGYKEDEQASLQKVIEAERRMNVLSQKLGTGKDYTPEHYEDWRNSQDNYHKENERHSNEFGASSTVPDAPFKQSWPDLALKRAVAKAAREGYDAVSWTPGEQQAARYDLSKQIRALRYQKNPDGTYDLGANKDPRTWAEHHIGENIPEGKLADFVGKDIAEKIIKDQGFTPAAPDMSKWTAKRNRGDSDWSVYDGEGELLNTYRVDAENETVAKRFVRHEIMKVLPDKDAGKILSGVDLKIGGEGMKRFYDKMLVDKANALGKKFGAKVEWKELPAQRNVGGVSGEDVMRHMNISEKDWDSYWSGLTQMNRDHLIESYRNATPGIKVPVLRLTPGLRDAATKRGFPLFARGLPFTFTPVDHDPFSGDASPRNMKAGVERHRSNGGRADLDRPVKPGPAASYGIRPPVMEQSLPDYIRKQLNSLE